MLLEQFNKKGRAKVSQLNDYLMENHNMTISKNKFPRKLTLQRLRENAEVNLVKIKGSNKKFQLEPDYAKFLCIKNITDEMLNEGIYDGSHRQRVMKRFVSEKVRNLLENGSSPREAIETSTSLYQRNSDFTFSNEYVTPVAIDAAEKYLKIHGANTNKESISELAGPDPSLADDLGSDLDVPVGPAPGGVGDAAPADNDTVKKATSSIAQADIIIGLREILDDLRDYAERMSRMQNEDIVAIFDAMMPEYGAEQTNKFKERSNEIMTAGVQAARQAAEDYDNLINRVVGIEADEDDPVDIEFEFDPTAEKPEIQVEPGIDMNEPVNSGVEGEPLGRDEVQVS